ncbi:MAG: biopolymer transporter ExbD, partial [Candidatus Zixiibacteriota bacterium]
GEVSLNDESISLQGLEQHLKTYGARASGMTFLLHADTDARHGKVVALMDLAKTAGFGKLAIATEEKKQK